MKKHLRKLNRTFISNEIHYYLIILSSCLLILISFWLISVPVVFLIIFRKQLKKIPLVLILIIAIVCLCRIVLYQPSSEIAEKAVVVNLKNNEVTIKAKGRKFIIYIPDHDFQIGETFIIKGTITKHEKSRRPGGFNFYNYYLARNIHGVIKNYEITNKEISNKYLFKRLIYKQLAKADTGIKPYLELCLLDNNTLEKPHKDIFLGSQLSHLVGYSGIYLVFLLYMIRRVFFHFNVKKFTQDTIEIIVILLLFFTLDNDLFLRFFIIKTLHFVSRMFLLRWTRLDVTSLYLVIIIAANPFMVYDTSFLITALILFVIPIYAQSFPQHNPFIKMLAFQVMVCIILFAFTSKISVFSILITPFAIGIGFMFQAISIITFIIPGLPNLFSGVEKIFILSNQINKLGELTMKEFSPIITVFFILSIFIIMSSHVSVKRIKRTLVVATLFFSYNNSRHFIPVNSIYFLDVGQGDTTIIDRQSSNTVIVIDAFRFVSDFLNSKNIQRIDHLFITHSDNDHMNELSSLIERGLVKNLYLNKYDQTKYSMKANYLIAGDIVKCGDVTVNVLGPLRDLNNMNDNSLVLKSRIDYLDFIFTGDIEETAENELLLYQKHQLKSDVLKIAHHGSNTSSSRDFIKTVNPKYGIISSGENNYGHPSYEVLMMLKNYGVTTFLTSTSGTIRYISQRKNYKWVKWLSI